MGDERRYRGGGQDGEVNLLELAPRRISSDPHGAGNDPVLLSKKSGGSNRRRRGRSRVAEGRRSAPQRTRSPCAGLGRDRPARLGHRLGISSKGRRFSCTTRGPHGRGEKTNPAGMATRCSGSGTSCERSGHRRAGAGIRPEGGGGSSEGNEPKCTAAEIPLARRSTPSTSRSTSPAGRPESPRRRGTSFPGRGVLPAGLRANPPSSMISCDGRGTRPVGSLMDPRAVEPRSRAGGAPAARSGTSTATRAPHPAPLPSRPRRVRTDPHGFTARFEDRGSRAAGIAPNPRAETRREEARTRDPVPGGMALRERD